MVSSDLADREEEFEQFQSFIQPIIGSDVQLVHVKVGSLQALKEQVEVLQSESHISLIILAGHGSRLSFSLNKNSKYSGSEIVKALVEAIPKDRWSDKVSVYLSSCRGASCIPEDANLLRELFAALVKAFREKGIDASELAVLAHGYFSSGVDSVRVTNHFLSEYLHRKKYLDAFELSDWLLLVVAGRGAQKYSPVILGFTVAALLNLVGNQISDVSAYEALDKIVNTLFLPSVAAFSGIFSYLGNLKGGVVSLRSFAKNNPTVRQRHGLLRDLLTSILPRSQKCSRLSQPE